MGKTPKMDPTIREQILAIRDMGVCNMFSVNEVQYYANQENFFELVVYLEDKANRTQYGNFILYGDGED